MAARYILGALALVFLVVALWRIRRDGPRPGPVARTWLLIATIFSAVSIWLGWNAPS